MEIAVWIAVGVLTPLFVVVGFPKITGQRNDLAERMAFVEDFSDRSIKSIGIAEVVGALGLFLPKVTEIAPILSPIAAVGLILIQSGAVVTHLRRSEYANIAVNGVLIALLAFVAWQGFTQ